MVRFNTPTNKIICTDVRKRKIEKHIVLFTCNDKPFPRPQDMVRTFAKVADMDKSKIRFQLIPFGSSFTGKLYQVPIS